MTLIVALLHIGFAALEMVLWTQPLGQKLFKTTAAFAAESAALAMNQGLYNLFLATGLLWALFSRKTDVEIFFLLCAIVAGIFGAVTVSPTIAVVQAAPAALALLAILLTGRTAR